MLKRGPNFVNMLEHWRDIEPDPNGYLRDFYDGRVWGEWTVDGGILFERGGIAFILNYDGFSPFGNWSEYSMGTIYLSIANLPRNERYRRENVIIVGMITGPDKVSGPMNGFLKPLVEELQVLYHGRMFRLQDESELCVRTALFAIVCDCPAARQITQFVSHSGICGCHRCHTKKTKMSEDDIRANWARDGKKKWKLKTVKFLVNI